MLQKVTEGEGQGRGENKDARLCRHGGGGALFFIPKAVAFNRR